jgi:protein TonB
LDELGRVAEMRRVGVSFRSADFQFSETTGAGGRGRAGAAPHTTGSPADAEVSKARQVLEEFTRTAGAALQQWRYDPPARGPLSFDVTFVFRPDGEVTALQSTGSALASAATKPSPEWAKGALRVGGNIRPPTKILDVRPVYPPAAQAARVSGMVILEILIGPDGSVQNASILRSVPLLDEAATDAVMQWRFTPTLLNGQPTPIVMTVTVNFTLQGGMRGRRPDDNLQPKPRSDWPAVIKDVKPRYPPEAMQSGLQGTVEVEATIGTDGKVSAARVIRSIPVFDDAALDAVRQWLFTPPKEPKTVTIELSFSLPRG